jgi:hypothetical protein
MHADVNRVLSKFIRGKDILAGELDISHVPFEWLKHLFKPPEDDPFMYNSYRLEERHAEFLYPYVSEPLDLEHYEYYVDAEARESKA